MQLPLAVMFARLGSRETGLSRIAGLTRVYRVEGPCTKLIKPSIAPQIRDTVPNEPLRLTWLARACCLLG